MTVKNICAYGHVAMIVQDYRLSGDVISVDYRRIFLIAAHQSPLPTAVLAEVLGHVAILVLFKGIYARHLSIPLLDPEFTKPALYPCQPL